MSKPVVTTTTGPILGVERDGIRIFRGVPYGAATGGTRRFLPPAPPDPWTETRECVRYGLPSPQPPGGLGVALPKEMADAKMRRSQPSPTLARPFRRSTSATRSYTLTGLQRR